MNTFAAMEILMDKMEVAPIVKWVGGKRQLIKDIKPLIPESMETYYEPFVGGGAVLFEIQPNVAIINDYNHELINTYNVIKDNVHGLIDDLKSHVYDKEYFYKIRALDREPGYDKLSAIKRASRLLYLNKTCFNGLYRVNSKGQFNSPFGSYTNPNIVNEEGLMAVSRYFNENIIVAKTGDFEAAVKDADSGDFVYFDPPYDPVSKSANFTAYSKIGFSREDQIRLRDLCVALEKKGVKFLLSNASTDFINEIYKGFNITEVGASRAINSNGAKRQKVKEVLVSNY